MKKSDELLKFIEGCFYKDDVKKALLESVYSETEQQLNESIYDFLSKLYYWGMGSNAIMSFVYTYNGIKDFMKRRKLESAMEAYKKNEDEILNTIKRMVTSKNQNEIAALQQRIKQISARLKESLSELDNLGMNTLELQQETQQKIALIQQNPKQQIVNVNKQAASTSGQPNNPQQPLKGNLIAPT